MMEANITLPDSTLVSDVERFCRLAAVFYGHHSADGTWIFTEARGRKCLALWQAGFDATGAQHQKTVSKCILRGGVRFEVSEAMRIVKALQTVAVEEVA